MTPGRISNADAVEAIDSRLRSLYRGFRDFGPNNPQLTTTIRQLHSVLKGLRLEAQEPNGPLNAASPTYSDASSRQLTPILKECDASLKVFATIVGKYRPTLDSRSNSFGSITSADSNSSSDISGHSFSTPVSVTVSPLARVLPVDYVGQTTDDQLAVVRSRFITHATRLASLLEAMKSPRPPYPSAPATSYFQSSSPTRMSSYSPHISPPISPMPSDDDDGLETIKDRIDSIAVRLAHQDLVSASLFSTASIDELWNIFYTELTYEGFSSNTLSEQKDILRAYIQDLGSRGFFKGTDAPSPQLPPREYLHSLPNYMVPGQAPATSSPQGSYPPDGLSPKEVVQPFDNNSKYHHSVKDSRLAPQFREGEVYIPYRPAPGSEFAHNSGPPHPKGEPKYTTTPPESVVADQQLALSPSAMANHANTPRTVPVHQHPSSLSSQLAIRDLPSSPPRDDSEDAFNENGFNFISTRRLLEIDWFGREQAAGRLGVTYTPPQLLEHGSHFSQAFPALATSPTAAAIVRQNSLQSQLSQSPSSPSRSSFFPPTSAGGFAPPPYHHSSSVSHPPATSHAAFGIMIPGSAAPPSPSQIPAGAELGPDSFGKPIPPDAIWTRITRKRISPEVLARAGVRFEARPTFVAILGVLSREQIAEYARQSVEARRSWRHSNPRNERPSPTGTSPPDYTARPERRQSMSGAGSDKHEREAVAAGLRAQTFPLAGTSPSSRDRDSSSIAGTANGSQGKGGAYPFIVSPPATEVDTSGTEGAPKSILKNKNKNKVRYRDGELVEVSPDESSRSHRHSRSYGDNHRHRSKSRAKSRHRDSDSRRDSSRHRDDEREHRKNSDRSRRRDDYDRDSDRDRERDHARNRSRHRDQDHDSSRRRHHRDDRSHDRERDDTRHRDRSRDRERHRDRDHDRERERDRSRDRERERDRDRTSSNSLTHQKSSYNLSSRGNRSGRDSRDSRDGRDGRDKRDGRDRDRDSPDHDSRERDDGRKRLRDTISAAGIGGVAGSFFSVLTEAASSF
ncbi:hypothetical protein F503_04923 [Ophiostoma piceae UAMH 11346]|uniref:DUF8035 domain-containing protein n=1 Tax=Ophiostoma piceae (strain UAMH 11346) TaxID=1262450 RepID=S3CTQ2_OPHP1|nr:hypothetical protein F503_04923 [Ophiostoma piceae UAMH 11346]